MSELNSKSVTLKNTSEVKFDIKKCIICQKDNKHPTTATENGRSKIISAGEKRKDIVYSRIPSSNFVDFVYHVTNECYKSYTLKKSLDKIQENEEPETIESSVDLDEELEPSRKRLRSSLTPRTVPSCTLHVNKLKCVICSKTRFGGIREKYRISECPRAKKFLEAAIYFRDELYTRVADLESESNVFGADLYYHKTCLEGYLKKYERAVNENEPSTRKPSLKRQCLQARLPELKDLLEIGMGIPLSDIRDMINENLPAERITNKEVKLYLVEAIAEDIQFCQPFKKSESLIVFSSKLKMQDVVARLQSINSYKEAGQKLRKTLISTSFNINDKFCDAEELQESWENVPIPEEFISFFSSLFNIPQTRLLNRSKDNENTSNDRKSILLKSLYQMMFYILHDGKQKTPLHFMVSHNIYEKCKSREVMISLNRIGVCISYNETVRARENLAKYTIAKSKDSHIPLPSHFSKDSFTFVAFDNFDHQDQSSFSGKFSNHDTVMSAFQVKPAKLSSMKPLKTEIDLSSIDLKEKLVCQEIIPLTWAQKDMVLCADREYPNEVFNESDVTEKHNRTEFSINAIRCASEAESNDLPTWAACRSLLIKSNIPLMQVGFLPYIPHPVTNYDTLYTALKNFVKLLDQLDQQSIPVMCEEGVYRIVVNIVLKNPSEFKCIIPMLGGFHMTKALLHCIGKYIKHTGFIDALTETDVFGIKIAEDVVAGTHYVRSVRGMLILSKVMKLQWTAFWECHKKEAYKNALESLDTLGESLCSNDNESCVTKFSNIERSTNELQHDFETFIEKCAINSYTCSYFQNFFLMVSHLKQLIAADRNGDWQSHLQAVQNILPIFRQFDSINYLRYGSFYLEKMRKLSEDHPAIYEKFMEGSFVVKQNYGNFNAVSGDLKLEQTINGSQKSVSGIIGQTRQREYITKFEVVYHEVLAISNMFRKLTNSNLGSGDTDIHHELKGNYCKSFNKDVSTVYEYFVEKGNPFITLPSKLCNMSSSEVFSDLVASKFLNCFIDGEKEYVTFRNERFITKTKKLSDTIRKISFPNLGNCIKSSKEQEKKSVTAKEIAQTQKTIEIVRSQGYDMSEVLQYELLSNNSLFHNHDTAKLEKHVLVKKLEEKIFEVTVQPNFDNNVVLVIDFMSLIRRIPTGQISNFEDLLDAAWKYVNGICKFKQVDFVYNSYIDDSLKESERLRRSNCDPIHLNDIKLGTKIPVQQDKFWASNSNKEQLQYFSSSYLKTLTAELDIVINVSGYIRSDQSRVKAEQYYKGQTRYLPDLDSDDEEADTRIISHLNMVSLSQVNCAVVLSNDTDVCVLLLYYMRTFKSNGLTKLWLRYGTGNAKRFIPIHIMHSSFGDIESSCILKTHILTGSDVTSEIGTKHGALLANPQNYLQQFGENEMLSDEDIKKAEEYLVKVLYRSSYCKTFTQLRVECYKHKNVSLINLPPTSRCIQGHICRSFYVIRLQSTLLSRETFKLQPKDYGWYTATDMSINPEKMLIFLPEQWYIRCSCKSVCNRCKCFKNDVCCTEFCACENKCACKPVQK